MRKPRRDKYRIMNEISPRSFTAVPDPTWRDTNYCFILPIEGTRTHFLVRQDNAIRTGYRMIALHYQEGTRHWQDKALCAARDG